jgi:PleD family two-component response regulator
MGNPAMFEKIPSPKTVLLILGFGPQQTDLCRLILEMIGFTVLDTDKPEKALTLLHETRPDLIILSPRYFMSRIEGLELCGLLRQRPDTAQTPIMMLATSPSDAVAAAQEAGINLVVSLPYKPNSFANQARILVS